MGVTHRRIDVHTSLYPIAFVSSQNLYSRVPVNIDPVLPSLVLIQLLHVLRKFRSNNGNRCFSVEVPRPVLVAVETWRSTNLQIPVQTFPQFFREQTVNKKVGTNVILFSINSPPFLSIGRSEIEKHKPTSRIQALKCDNRADRSLLTNTPQSFDELLSAELCNILRIL